MGDLHGDPVLSPLRCFWGGLRGDSFFLRCAVCFLNLPLGRFIRGNPFFLRSAVCSFWERLTRGFASFSVALFVFLNLPLGRFIRGNPFFSPLQCGAVLYFCCMARGGRFWLCFFVVFGRLGRRFGVCRQLAL